MGQKEHKLAEDYIARLGDEIFRIADDWPGEIGFSPGLIIAHVVDTGLPEIIIEGDINKIAAQMTEGDPYTQFDCELSARLAMIDEQDDKQKWLNVVRDLAATAKKYNKQLTPYDIRQAIVKVDPKRGTDKNLSDALSDAVSAFDVDVVGKPKGPQRTNLPM